MSDQSDLVQALIQGDPDELLSNPQIYALAQAVLDAGWRPPAIGPGFTDAGYITDDEPHAPGIVTDPMFAVPELGIDWHPLKPEGPDDALDQ